MYLYPRLKIWLEAPPPCTIGTWYFSATDDWSSASLEEKGPRRKLTLSEVRSCTHCCTPRFTSDWLSRIFSASLYFFPATVTPPFSLIRSTAIGYPSP